MAFADEVKISVKAGDGGNGLVSFLRNRMTAKGGPDGGDGGSGGSVLLVADHNETSLAYFLRNRTLKAESGGKGQANQKTGKSGDDLVLKVPVGTQVIEAVLDKRKKTKEYIIADLNRDGAKFVMAQGGKGGFGNMRFARSNFQVPRFAELGEPGEDKDIILRLKMIAEVGLIGLPNAGKSTLLSVISNARPRIADYVFTTLVPNLGIVEAHGKRFLVADIPGIIEGAHQGKGLGIDFLKHTERTKLLVHLIDATIPNPKTQFKVINTELKKYSRDLAAKPQLIVFTKIDAVAAEQLKVLKKLKFAAGPVADSASGTEEPLARRDESPSGAKPPLGRSLTRREGASLNQRVLRTGGLARRGQPPVFYISAAAHTGVKELVQKMAEVLRAIPDPSADIKVYTLDDLPSTRFEVGKQKGKFFVKGDKVERLLIRTDIDNEQALGRLYKVLNRMGVLSELRKLGAKEEDPVKIGQKTIEYKNI